MMNPPHDPSQPAALGAADHPWTMSLQTIKEVILEVVTGLMLGALIGGIMGISASPIARDVIVGLVALLGMFFGLTDKSGGTKSESKSESKSETSAETKTETKSETSITGPEGSTGGRAISRIRLITFCVGCLGFLGLGIQVRDTMLLVPVEYRPWHRLTLEQKIERIQARDETLTGLSLKGDDRKKFLEEVERQDERTVETNNEEPTVGAAVRRTTRKPDPDGRCARYVQLLMALSPAEIIAHYRTVPDGWEIEVANYVDKVVSTPDQLAALTALTGYYCTP